MAERVPCVCCGLTTWPEDPEQPTCGHKFCDICLGRGHDEDCIACETYDLEDPHNAAGGPDGAQ